jgi:hypothetical protein
MSRPKTVVVLGGGVGGVVTAHPCTITICTELAVFGNSRAIAPTNACANAVVNNAHASPRGWRRVMIPPMNPMASTPNLVALRLTRNILEFLLAKHIGKGRVLSQQS